MDSLILYYASLFFIGTSVFILAHSVFSEEDKFKTTEQLDDIESEKGKSGNDTSAVLKYSRPFFKRYISPIVSGMKNKGKIREKYKKKLANAGLTQELTPDDFFSFKLFLIIGFPILFLIIRVAGEFYEWPLIAIPAISIAGYFYPDIWISGMISSRQEDVTVSMPFIVDMLALSVEAGLDFMAAITRVIEKAPPSGLSEEFEIMVKEVKIGSSRAEALRSLAWRIDLIQVSSFCATLVAADSVGANIAPILKALAIEMRQKKSADAEKKGASAATKLLFPMLFIITPAVFIIIGTPIGLQFIYGN